MEGFSDSSGHHGNISGYHGGSSGHHDDGSGHYSDISDHQDDKSRHHGDNRNADRLGHEEVTTDQREVAQDVPFWKKGMKSSLVTFGLFLLVIAYSVGGAYIYMAIEKPAEKQRKIDKLDFSYDLLDTQNNTIGIIYDWKDIYNISDSVGGKEWRNNTNMVRLNKIIGV